MPARSFCRRAFRFHNARGRHPTPERAGRRVPRDDAGSVGGKNVAAWEVVRRGAGSTAFLQKGLAKNPKNAAAGRLGGMIHAVRGRNRVGAASDAGTGGAEGAAGSCRK